jgi:hypothetical protein
MPVCLMQMGDDPESMYLTSHFGFAAVASGNDLESKEGQGSRWARFNGEKPVR